MSECYRTMNLVAGTYDKSTKAFTLDLQSLTLTPPFSSSHSSPIKSVAVCGSFAASDDSTDKIHLYDFTTRSTISLHHYSATALSFYAPPLLVSANAAGSLSC
ncbi:hypothetical protein GYH30_024447 [Glycine max]|nr:hypothetical protein GYH30_024447 [Glycine max]